MDYCILENWIFMDHLWLMVIDFRFTDGVVQRDLFCDFLRAQSKVYNILEILHVCIAYFKTCVIDSNDQLWIFGRQICIRFYIFWGVLSIRQFF